MFLLALVVRAVTAWASPVVPRDAVGLVGGARRVAGAGWAALLELPLHPLPPALLSRFADRADLGLVATALAVLCGALAVWPLHALARRAVGRHAAGAACLIYAALPKAVHVAAVPLTEPLLLPLFLGALSLAAAACERRGRSVRRAAAAGVLAGAAYLVRPEGLVAAAVCGVLLLLARGARIRRVVPFVLAFALVGGPWVVAMSRHHDRVVLSPKKDLARFAGTDGSRPTRALVAAPVSPHTRVTPLAAVRGVASGLEGALTVPVGLLVLLGLLTPRRWRQRRARRGRILLAGTALFLVALVVRLRFGWGYGGGRHLVVAGTLLLPFAGAALFGLARLLPRVRSRRRFAMYAGLILALALGMYAVLRPPGRGGMPARALGEDLAVDALAGAGAPVRVATVAEPRVVYYMQREGRTGARDVPLWGPVVEPITRGAPLDAVGDVLTRLWADEPPTYVVLDLWKRGPASGPEHPQRALYEELVDRGLIERAAVSSRARLAAFRVRPAAR